MFSAHHLIMLYSEVKLCEVPQRISELQTQTLGLTLGCSQFTKGRDSAITVDGVMLPVLCPSFL